MPERDAGEPSKVYNSACVCGPEGIVGSRRKIRLPPPEMFWAVPGDYPLIFQTEWGPWASRSATDLPRLSAGEYLASIGARG